MSSIFTTFLCLLLPSLTPPLSHPTSSQVHDLTFYNYYCPTYTQPTDSTLCCSYVHVFRADHFGVYDPSGTTSHPILPQNTFFWNVMAKIRVTERPESYRFLFFQGYENGSPQTMLDYQTCILYIGSNMTLEGN